MNFQWLDSQANAKDTKTKEKSIKLSGNGRHNIQWGFSKYAPVKQAPVFSISKYNVFSISKYAPVKQDPVFSIPGTELSNAPSSCQKPKRKDAKSPEKSAKIEMAFKKYKQEVNK